ncbi:kinase-like domain-containing protein [Suillus spraguei]|nr:kinase-like domain-containing protein [Suillus spraguei]
MSTAPDTLVHTFTHSGMAEASRIPPVPYSYGFRILCILAEGGYSTAVGAQDIASNRLLCLKVFRKDCLNYRSTEKVLFNELEVYKRIASSMPFPATRFIMELEMSFQTKDCICFAMDLMTSDLRAHMKYGPTYCLYHARRWTAQIALGINALHEIGIIHRDIKSENILIDVRENVRITDFGLSYVNQHRGPLKRQEYTAHVVGTTYCMAPEVLHNKLNPGSMKYGAPVDWWALGCVIYELVSSEQKACFASSFTAILMIPSCQAPFVTEDDISFYVSWCYGSGRTSKQSPIFKDFHENVADLISGLLEPVPSSRYGFHEVVNHKWFLLAYDMTEFSYAHSRALRREELSDALPNLRYGQETHTAAVWLPLPSWEKPRTPNVDWINPAFFSFL